MGRNLREYHRPATIQEAERLIRRRSVRTAALAGGSALLARRDPGVEAVVDLSGLNLSYIRQGKGGIDIGAMTTLQDLVTSPLLSSFAGGLLASAAHYTATRTVRNAATIGGSIVACGQASDVVVALLALDAVVVPASGSATPLSWLLGMGTPARLLLEVRIPAVATTWASSLQRVACLPADQAIVNVAGAARIENHVCTALWLAAGGVGATPLRLHLAEQLLTGTELADSDIEQAIRLPQKNVDPPSDILGSSEYRRAMLGVLLRRAVQQCRTLEG